MKARLIPGLPDCIALHCLFLHLPFHAIPAARAVCKRWNHELTSPSFYRLRSATGLAPRVISMLFRGKLSHTVGKVHVTLYEPATDICMIRQLAANRTKNSNRCNHSIIVGRELLVIGGWNVMKNCRTGKVHIYDLLSGAWRTGAPMPVPEQPFCRLGLHEGKVFVIGFIDAEGKKLPSTLVYDVAIDKWFEMPDLEHNTCRGNLYDKFWRCKGEYNRAIQWCKMLRLLHDDENKLSFNLTTTMDEKEIIIVRFPINKSNEKVEIEEVILSTYFLQTLQRRLGLRPNEISRYLEAFYMCRL